MHCHRIASAVALALGVAAHRAHAQTPTVSVGGVIYTHFGYQLDTDTTLAVPGHRNNIDVSRSYITVNGKSGTVTARITADVDGRRAASNQQTFRLKYAFLSYAPDGFPVSFKLGAIPTPFIEWDEAMWGYRMQGTVALDRNSYLTSSDFGFGVDGSWLKERINFQSGIYNGEGYNNAPGDQYKDVAARASFRLAGTDDSSRIGGLRVTGFALFGTRTGGGTRQRLLAMLSYKTKALTVAAQVAETRDSLAATAPDVAGRVVSAYVTWGVPKSKVRVLARVDLVDPDVDSEPSTPSLSAGRQARVIAGVSYELTPNVRVLADADLNSLRHGSPSAAFTATRQTLFFHAEYRF